MAIAELWTGERLVLRRSLDPPLRAVVAVDDTTLGPGLGGVRFKPYPSEEAAVAEAQRLAAAMTRKNAVAELPFGGAKSVILADGPAPTGAAREAMMRTFGSWVAELGGAYLPGVDMGTTTADLATMRRAGATVACDEEDPSPWTALGVFVAARAAARHVDGADSLRGLRVAVQGAGHVGAALAELCARDGADVLIADVDPARASSVAAAVGGHAADPATIATTPCDVFAPCAVARVITADTVDDLRCRIVAGAANDTLDADTTAAALAAAGITYVPDFVANAGGVIHIHALRNLAKRPQGSLLRGSVLAIGERTAAILEEAACDGVTPLAAAEARATARIAAARAERQAVAA